MQPIPKAVDSALGKRDVAEGSTRPVESTTETMKAVCYQGKKEMAVERVPKPMLTHPGTLLAWLRERGGRVIWTPALAKQPAAH